MLQISAYLFQFSYENDNYLYNLWFIWFKNCILCKIKTVHICPKSIILKNIIRNTLYQTRK